MDETLWELFWTTGLPEAYALAKEGGQRNEAEQLAGCGSPSAPCSQEIKQR